MAYVWEIVDGPGGATLLSFHNPTGTGNPGTVKTKTLGTPNLPGPTTERTIFSPPGRSGDSVVHRRHGNKEIDFAISAQATTIENMRTFMNALAGYLDAGKTVKWQPEGQTNPLYIDFEPGNSFLGLYRGQDLPPFTHDVYGLPITLYCQPFFYGDEVTLTQVTRGMDPATGSGRTYGPFTIQGTAPTPVTMKLSGTGNVNRWLVGVTDPAVAASYVGNHFSQVEGWTLNNGTTSQVNTGASGGSVAQTSFTTTAAFVIRAQRTITTPALSGRFRAYLRLRGTGTMNATVQLGMQYGQGATGTSFAGYTRTFDIDSDLDFRNIYALDYEFPSGVSSISFWLYAGRNSGAGELRFDVVSFIPAYQLGELIPSTSGEVRTFPDENAVRIYTGGVLDSDFAWMFGPVPMTLDPGTYALGILGDTVTGINTINTEDVLTSPTLTISGLYRPRWWL